ncbi:MAG: M48 family metallopeptidase [Proteobacteria bacterium]|nr:M48 family metallopeptidase [Pseudomonadota bacterium]
MDYSNPEIPEGINTSKQHPLKDFIILTGGVLGGIALCAFLLSLFVEHLAVYIPFSVEQQIMQNIDIRDAENSNPEMQNYLDELSSNLLPYIDLPKDITINIHYIDEPIENAYATLAGHISIYRGLIELLPNENALAMVIAHEIAHIKQRDPVVAPGRGIVVGLFLTAIAGTSTDRFVSSVITDTGTITVLGFNRNQERCADEIALKAVAAYYGHVNGADTLFKEFLKTEKNINIHTPEFFSTHPLSEDRITNLHDTALMNGWALDGKTTELPSLIKFALTD